MANLFQLILLLAIYLLCVDAMHRNTSSGIRKRPTTSADHEKNAQKGPSHGNEAKKAKSPANPLKAAVAYSFDEPKTPEINDGVGVVPEVSTSSLTSLGTTVPEHEAISMESEKSTEVDMPTTMAEPEQNEATNTVPENATVSNESENEVSTEVDMAEAMEAADPKSQHAELLEMNDALVWEMAVRSENAQVLDKSGELAWFPNLIFHKLDKFLQNIGDDGTGMDQQQHKEQLANLVTNWRETKVTPIDVDQETVHIFEIQNSLSKVTDELHDQNMQNVKATPAIYDVVLDIVTDEAHVEQKMEFLWKMVNRKAVRYVKNVGQFFGYILIATAYLNQTLKVARWASEYHFLAPEQLENVSNEIHANLAKLDNMQQSVAIKMGIDLSKIGASQLLVEQMPSLETMFMRNLAENLNKIKAVAQLEEVQFDEKQIGTFFVVTALIIANYEVEKLEDEILGLQLTWALFQAVGEVSKAANVLQQMHI